MKKNPLHMVTFCLMAIGGLNWLLVGFGYNLVEAIFGMDTMVTRVIYILVGVSAIYELAMHKQFCKMCGMMMAKDKPAPMGGSMGGGSSMGGKM